MSRASLAELLAHVSPGHELLELAQRSLDGHAGTEMMVRVDRRRYLVRLGTAQLGQHGGLSLLFTEAPRLNDHDALALVQRRQSAALARMGELMLSEPATREIGAQGLRALCENIAPCSAGLIAISGASMDLRVLATRGLAHPRRALAKAQPLVLAALERRCIAASSGQSFPLPSAGAPPQTESPAPGQHAGDSPEAGVACPIIAGGELQGVIVLFGHRPTLAGAEYWHFIQAIGDLVGGAVLRERSRQRTALELELSRVAASAGDMASMCSGLGAVFEHIWPGVAVELWGQHGGPEARWQCLFPVMDGDVREPPWQGGLLPPTSSEAAVCESAPGGDLLVLVAGEGEPFYVLRLAGAHLASLDRGSLDALRASSVLLGACLRRCRLHAATRDAAAAQRVRNAELEALYASLPVALSIHDRRGIMRHGNARLALSPPRTPRAEALEQLYSELLPPWVRQVLEHAQNVHDLELSVQREDKRWFWLCQLAPIIGADGSVHGASVSVQDITALKRSEAS